MKLRAYKIEVIRDEMTRISKEVWGWELPMLEAIYPGGLVVQNGEIEVERDSSPEARAEYFRLANVYKAEPETKRDYVEIVYGYGESGVKELAKLIKKSTVKDRKPTSRKKVTAKKPDPAKPQDPLGV